LSSLIEIKNTIDQIGRVWDEYKQVNDQRVESIRRGDYAKMGELGAKLERIEADLQQLDGLKSSLDRLEELESRVRTPGRPNGDGKVRPFNPEYTKHFEHWIRSGGKNPQDEAMMAEIERKDVTIGSNPGGGYAVPKEIAQQIERFELRFSPVRRLVRVERIGSSDFHFLLNLRGTTSGWASETSTRGASNTPQLRDIVPTHGELYALPSASQWAMDDVFFDVAGWLAENIGDEFALQLGDACIRGNGSSKPTGLINTTPVTTDDFASPVRAAAAFQYVPSVASPFAVTADSLIDCLYKLNSAYRTNGTWVMNSTTTGAVRKLKDTTNQYLWAPGLAAGEPNRLLGYPQETWEQMDDVGSAKFPVAFGDWRRAYLLVDRTDLRILRDEVTTIGMVRFYARRRVGGMVLNNDAAKFIRTA